MATNTPANSESYRITHVFVGPRTLVGRTFSARIPNLASAPWCNPFAINTGTRQNQALIDDKTLIVPIGFREPSGMLFYPPPVLEAVAAKDGDSHARYKMTWFYPTSFANDGRHSAALQIGSDMQAIYNESDKRRLKTIDRIIRGNDGERSVTALNQLAANATGTRITEYFMNLSLEPSLPIVTQIALWNDLRLRKKDWVGTSGEIEMVNHWFAGRWEEPADDATRPWMFRTESAVLYSLRSIGFGFHPDGFKRICERELELGIKGLANPKRSWLFKKYLLAELKPLKTGYFSQARAKNEGFAFLLGVVKSKAPAAEKVAAAQLMDLLTPLDDEQERDLRALITTLGDRDLVWELRERLRRQ